MKKAVSLLLSVIIFFSSLSVCSLSSFALTSEDWEYTVSGANATITGYTGEDSDLVIPSSIEGYTVTAIGERALSEIPSIENITIPYGVKTIEPYAFYYSTNLAGISIPDSVTRIGHTAFAGCTALRSINIPGSVTKIEGWLFGECPIEYITIGNGVKEIADHAFDNCTIEQIVIPDSVTIIGEYAFYWSLLSTVTIGKSVSKIGYRAFTGCPIGSIKYTGSMAQWNKIEKADAQISDSAVVNCANKPAFKVSNTANGVSLSWNSVSAAKGYCVYRKTGSESYTKLASGSALSYTDKTAKSGVSYTYAIKAYNGKVRSSYKEIAVLRLANPAVTVTNTSDGIKASWKSVAGAKGYYVYKKTGSGSYSKIATVSSLSYTDKSVKAGTKYTYAVYAYNGSYKSACTPTALIRLTIPSVKLSNTKNGPKISWAKVTGAKGYYVYRRNADGSYKKLATTTSLSFVDKATGNGEKYYYAVRAYNGSSRSAYKNTGITCKRMQTYVLNINTGRFHHPSCSSVYEMKAKNRRNVTDYRDNIVKQGYVPCKRCNP